MGKGRIVLEIGLPTFSLIIERGWHSKRLMDGVTVMCAR
jgi:hypothetical protein